MVKGEPDQLDNLTIKLWEAIPSMKNEMRDRVVNHLCRELARACVESYRAGYHNTKGGYDCAPPYSN